MRRCKQFSPTPRAVTQRLTAGAFVVLFAAAHYVIYLLFPLVNDDLWYSEKFLSYVLHGVGDFPWRQMADTVVAHIRLEDNVRLANIVLLPLLALPRWLSAIVPAVAVGLLLVGVARLAGLRRRPGMLMLTAAALCISFLLPWHESFFTFCFSLNYVFPAAMMSWFLIALFRSGDGTHDGPRHWRWLAPVNAVLLGGFNEAFSLPLVGASVLLVACFREFRTRRFRVLFVCLCIGTLYVLVSRLFIIGSDTFAEAVRNTVIKVVKLQVPLTVYLVMLGIAAWRRGWRSVATPYNLVLVAVALASVVINIIFQRGERISTCAHLASICGILRMAAAWVTLHGVSRRVRALAVGGGIALLAAHYVAVTRMVVRMHREWESIYGVIFSPDGPSHNVIFTDVTVPEFETLLAWRKPSGDIFVGWGLTVVNMTVSLHTAYDGPKIYFIPSELRRVTANSGTPVPGTAGVRRLGRFYFVPFSEQWAGILPTRMGPFTKQMHFYDFRFTSEADGRDYLFLFPEVLYFPSFLLPVDSVDLPE